jgi:hypothetical protein
MGSLFEPSGRDIRGSAYAGKIMDAATAEFDRQLQPRYQLSVQLGRSPHPEQHYNSGKRKRRRSIDDGRLAPILHRYAPLSICVRTCDIPPSGSLLLTWLLPG